MAIRRPVYRLTVFKPRSEDPTETAVLTPIAGAAHADPFVLTTLQGVAGAKPYLGFPKGRQGSIDPITKATTIGNLALPVFDPRVTPGGANAVRWVTAFIGDTRGRPRLKGCKYTLERSLDGTAASLAPYFAGRIRDYALDDPQWITLALKDFSDDLKRRVFTGAPHASVAGYASPSAILPLGLPQAFGGLTPVARAKGQLTFLGAGTGTGGADRGQIRFDASEDVQSRVVTKAAFDAFHQTQGTKPTVAVVKFTASGATGYFRWDGATERPIQWYKTDSHVQYELVDLRTLPVTDPRYTAFPNAVSGAVLACELYLYVDAPPTPALPILVNDVHVVQHFADVLDGKFSRAPGYETLRPLAQRDTAPGGPWDVLLQDPSWGTIRNVVPAPAKANEYIEQVICGPKSLGYRFDAQGRIVPIDLRRTNSTTGALVLGDDDLVADVEPRWGDSRSGAITAVEYSYYVDRLVQPKELLDSAERYPEGSPSLIASVKSAVIIENDLSTLRDVGEKVIKIDGVGARVTDGELDASGQARRALLEQRIRAEVTELLRPFGSGTLKATATYRAGGAAAGLAVGMFALVQHAKLPDPATNQRGGVRLMLCLSAADVDDRIAVEWLDCGANTVALVPTIATPTSPNRETIDVALTLNAAGDPVELWTCVTPTTTAVRPLATDAGWSRVGALLASGTLRATGLPSGKRVWVRARSLALGGALAQPSTFAFPVGTGYVDLAAPSAPTGLAVTTPSADVARVTWTVGEAAFDIELLFVAGAAPGAWTDAMILGTLPLGTTGVDVDRLTGGATYTVGVRHRNPETGAVTAVTASTFVAGAAAAVIAIPQAPVGYSAGVRRFGSGGLRAESPPIAYGLAVVAGVLPGRVEFRQAVESAPGSAVFAAAVSVALVDAVADDWTRCVLEAPSDGRKRRLSARSVVGTATSAWTTDVELLPATALALRAYVAGTGLTADGLVRRAAPWDDGQFAPPATTADGLQLATGVKDSRAEPLNEHFRYGTDGPLGIVETAGQKFVDGAYLDGSRRPSVLRDTSISVDVSATVMNDGRNKAQGAIADYTGGLRNVAKDSRTEPLNLHFRYGTDSAVGVVETLGQSFVNTSALDASRRVSGVYSAADGVTQTGGNLYEGWARATVAIADRAATLASAAKDSRSEPLNLHFRYGTDSALGVVETAGQKFVDGAYLDGTRRPFQLFNATTASNVGGDVIDDGRRKAQGLVADYSGGMLAAAKDSRAEPLNAHFRYGTDSTVGVVATTGRNFVANVDGSNLITPQSSVGRFRCKVNNNTATQNVSDLTDTIIVFGGEAYDTGNLHSTSTNNSRITVPTGGNTGVWQLVATVSWDGLSSGSAGTITMRIKKTSGATVTTLNIDRRQAITPAAIALGDYQTIVAFDDSPAVGDYYEVEVYQNSGATRSIQSAGAVFAATHLW